jgi:hypothetical protein
MFPGTELQFITLHLYEMCVRISTRESPVLYTRAVLFAQETSRRRPTGVPMQTAVPVQGSRWPEPSWRHCPLSGGAFHHGLAPNRLQGAVRLPYRPQARRIQFISLDLRKLSFCKPDWEIHLLGYATAYSGWWLTNVLEQQTAPVE